MFDAIERGLFFISSYLVGSDVDSACQLRAPIDTHTFVTENNSLLTLYRVVGSRRHIGEEEFNRQSEALATTLVSLLKSGFRGEQHSLCFGFRSSPQGGELVIKNVLGPSLKTARRLGADADFIFQDKLAAMGPACVDEMALFGVMTHSAGLTPSERKRWDQHRKKQFEALAGAHVALDPTMTQTPMGPPSVMLSRHNAALSMLEGKISAEGARVQVMMDRLTCHEVVSIMRRFLDAGSYLPNWRPTLLGDRAVSTTTQRSTRTVDSALPMRIGRQIVTEKLIDVFGDAEVVKRGRYWYASVTMDVCPSEEPMPTFSELAASIGTQAPWQVHFDISPNGLGFNRMEQLLAAFTGAAGDHNKSVKQAFDSLKAMKSAGTYVAALRAIFTTWATTEVECVDNLSFLKSKVEGWGQSVASNESGSPSLALLASAPGFARQLQAPYIPGPMDVLTRMTPMFRPSSIWDAGQLVLFTREGRPYPIALGSPAQNYWGTLIFAPTGSGKSFLMNMLNAGILFSPGASELPMCTIIDKGPSAKGVVRFAQAILPPALAAQVVYWRPTPSDANYCVNPFDTQLGCDRPLEADRDFLSALMGGIAPNLGQEGGKFIGRVIDVAYEYFCRVSPTAKRWQWNTNPDLSAKLGQIGINFTEEKPPRVWDVVDAFFDRGMIEEAGRAQFYAVPQMGDITTVLQDRRVLDIYGTAPTPSGEMMVKVFERNMIAAANEYKVFFGITRHTSTARFVVVDIEGMASASTSEEGARRFGLMMLFARRLGARNFFLHPDDLRDVCPQRYLAYQVARVQRIREEPKFLEYDEIHNAKGITAVQGLLQKDAREGRKYNVVAILSSQDLSDFPEDLVKNSYNFFILGAGNAASSKDLQRTFDLTDSEVQVIMQECTAPGKLFGMFRTNRGMLSQLLFTKPGVREVWAYNTSPNDMALRDALYERVGVKRAIGFLAETFPSGSARQHIDEVRRAMGEGASADDGVTELIIKRLEGKIEAHRLRTA